MVSDSDQKEPVQGGSGTSHTRRSEPKPGTSSSSGGVKSEPSESDASKAGEGSQQEEVDVAFQDGVFGHVGTKEERLLDSLIDDVIFCECLQVHRAAKMGFIFTEPSDEVYTIKDGAGLDVFGQPLSKKKQYNCICPNCSRNLAASRLAPHLEKCMGMGRLSARAATSKRDNNS